MTATQYLEAAKAEELAGQLRAQGYEVVVESEMGTARYDLVATKHNRKIAFEIKAKAHLSENLGHVRRLREKALSEGYDEFRLVIVSPPHEVSVSIAGLSEALLSELIHSPPAELNNLASKTVAQEVSEVTVDAVEITTDGIRVRGDGLVGVTIFFDSVEDEDDWSDSFPFTFDVHLDHALSITNVNGLQVDTDSFHDEKR